MIITLRIFSFFFFNDTATTEIYTLSLHDALPICGDHALHQRAGLARVVGGEVADVDIDGDAAGLGPGVYGQVRFGQQQDRKSTRLNSSHLVISYAVFCLKKKKIQSQAEYRVDRLT